MNYPLFEKMISLEYLFESWYAFRRGKRKKLDVQIFERHLEDNIFSLRDELASCEYKHGPYFQFDVFDPKRRFISAASVRDRLVHQMVFSLLSDVFEKRFIFHSFSSRLGKGTHLGCDFLKRMLLKASQNGSQDCYALKMDVRRFFANVDQALLKQLLQKAIGDEKMLEITDIIIDSFQTEGAEKIGLPLGNVTTPTTMLQTI